MEPHRKSRNTCMYNFCQLYFNKTAKKKMEEKKEKLDPRDQPSGSINPTAQNRYSDNQQTPYRCSHLISSTRTICRACTTILTLQMRTLPLTKGNHLSKRWDWSPRPPNAKAFSPATKTRLIQTAVDNSPFQVCSSLCLLCDFIL